MKKQILILSLLITVLLAVATLASLLTNLHPEPFLAMTERGTLMTYYGKGLYQYDSLMVGAGNVGLDAVILFITIPCLLIATLSYAKDRVKAHYLLMGIHAFILYVYLTHSIATAYNALFLVYVALFSLSFFALALLMTTFNLNAFVPLKSPTFPKKRLLALLFIASIGTFVIWLEEPIATLFFQAEPTLFGRATLVTHALDLALIVPTLFVAALMIKRNNNLGVWLSIPLLGILVFLGPAISAMTLYQLYVGVDITVMQAVMFIMTFLLMSGYGLYVAFKIFSSMPFEKVSM